MMKVLVITDFKNYLPDDVKVKELDLSDEAIEKMALERYPIEMVFHTEGEPYDVSAIFRHVFTESLKHLREKL